MRKTLYVGNLPYSASDDDIEELFSKHGAVHSIKLISDRETGRFRGFGFVEMDGDEALAAMEALDGTDFGGRTLRVNEARDRKDRPKRNRW